MSPAITPLVTSEPLWGLWMGGILLDAQRESEGLASKQAVQVIDLVVPLQSAPCGLRLDNQHELVLDIKRFSEGFRKKALDLLLKLGRDSQTAHDLEHTATTRQP